LPGGKVNIEKLDDLPVEELWALHEEVTTLLRQRIMQEKAILEARLTALTASAARRRRLAVRSN
jgi:hypothetical protein